MRTSNKVILFTLIGFFMVVLSAILMLRSSHMANMEYSVFSAYAKIFGNGNVVTQNYEFTNEKFTAINVKIPCHVEVKIAERAPQGRGVAITTDSNLLPYINVQVINGVLYVTSKKNTSLETTFITKLIVTTDSLNAIESNGSSKIFVDNIHGDNFLLNIRGAGESILQGKVDNLVVNVYGTGNVMAKDLVANVVKVVIRGAGDVIVYATKSLGADITGSGRVSYYGNPGQVVRLIRGFGEIRDMSVGMADKIKDAMANKMENKQEHEKVIESNSK